jgi:signal transduction histidine kinase
MQKIRLSVCQAYYPEVSFIIKSGGYPDVLLTSYPFDCLGSKRLSANETGTSKLFTSSDEEQIIIGSSCFPKLPSSKAGNQPNISFVRFDYCTEILIPKELVEYYIRKQYYLVSNGWLQLYKSHIKRWGFDREAAHEFFAESAKKLLFLNTGIPGDTKEPLDILSDYTGLPVKEIPIGLTHCRLVIDKLVISWREKKESRQYTDNITQMSRQLADHYMVLDQMQKLANRISEEEIVKEVAELLHFLLVPRQVSYRESGQPPKVVLREAAPESGVPDKSEPLIIQVKDQEEPLGEFIVEGIHYDEYLSQYKQFTDLIEGLSSLAISNARRYKALKENEKRLEILASDLSEVNASKDRFFSIIAHDLRGPIGSFIGLTEMIVEGLQEKREKDVKAVASAAQKSAINLYSLLENLLEWSKLQLSLIEPTFESVCLSAMAREETELMQSQVLAKRITLDIAIPEELCARADRNMIRTVIRNLLSNAFKFSHEGGTVRISACPEPGQKVRVSVEDNGIGIPGDLLDQLFQINSKTKRKGTAGEPSSGLGLVLCHEFIQRMNGQLFVESEINRKTVFSFVLPMCEPTPASPLPRPTC